MLNTLNLYPLLSDPIRLRILEILMSGQACTAGELARLLAVAPNQLSHHLNKLLDYPLITCQPMGRHRVYAIANDETAAKLERLVSSAEQFKIHPYRIDPQLRKARSCYKHLAGSLAVQLFENWRQHTYFTWCDKQLLLTDKGMIFFHQFDVPENILQNKVLKYCTDFTERKPHLAGPLGMTLLHYFLEQRWLHRQADTRILKITTTGQKHFADLADQIIV